MLQTSSAESANDDTTRQSCLGSRKTGSGKGSAVSIFLLKPGSENPRTAPPEKTRQAQSRSFFIVCLASVIMDSGRQVAADPIGRFLDTDISGYAQLIEVRD